MADDVRDYSFATTRTIRIMSDYCSSPLWGDIGIPVDSLGLSDDVVARLSEWQGIFAHNFHHESGWSGREIQQCYTALGLELLPLVAEQLPGYRVELHLWAGDDQIVRAGGGYPVGNLLRPWKIRVFTGVYKPPCSLPDRRRPSVKDSLKAEVGASGVR